MSEPVSASSNASASTSTTTGSSRLPTSKRPPTLDDIAARLKPEAKGPTVPKEAAAATSEAGRPRLGLTGRLNSNADPNSVNVGSDSSAAKDSTDLLSESTSRSKGHKPLPSLDDIRAHMNKRNFQDATSKFEPPNETQAAQPDVCEKEQAGEDAGGSKEATSAAESTAAELKTPPNKSYPQMSAADAGDVAETPGRGQVRGVVAPPAASDSQHPLQHQWTLYFDSKTWNPSKAGKPDADESLNPASSQQDTYEATLKKLGVYKTVESFMGTFATLRRPTQLENGSNYHFFKDGIKPMWEDRANASGGKWTVMLRGTNPELLNRSWTWLVLALIGEELDEADDITGAVCSIRPKGHRIALWLRKKEDVDRVNRIGRRLAHLLKVEDEPGVSMDFTPHDGAPSYGKSTPSKFISFQNKAASNQGDSDTGSVFSRSGFAFGSIRGGASGGAGSRFSTPTRAPGGGSSRGALGTSIGRGSLAGTPLGAGPAQGGRPSDSRFAQPAAPPSASAAAGTE